MCKNYVRLCIGLEHFDDIIEDLDQALNKSSKGTLKAVSQNLNKVDKLKN